MKSKKRTLEPGRRRPVQRRAKVTVEAMLDAAIVILKRKGITAITTNHIAETAGVSIGSVYQYFPNKSAIFVALHRRHVEQVDQVMLRCLAQIEVETLDELVNRMLEGMLEAHGADTRLSDLLQSEVPHRAEGSLDFATRLTPAFQAALSECGDPGVRKHSGHRAFFVATMVDAFAHAILLRRPRGLALRGAKEECCQAIVSYLRS
jgi:AcrR family transcriptional regulator